MKIYERGRPLIDAYGDTETAYCLFGHHDICNKLPNNLILTRCYRCNRWLKYEWIVVGEFVLDNTGKKIDSKYYAT